LQLLSNIAIVTQKDEPKTLAYCWLKRTEDCTTVPGQYVCGFEVYEDEAASKVVHRSSEPYKKMRAILGTEKIQEKPTDLSYCRPTGIGFLTRGGRPTVFQGSFPTSGAKSLVEVWELMPKDGMKIEALGEIEKLATYVEREEEGTSSFWILEFLPEYSNSNLKVISRFDNRAAYDYHNNSPLVKSFRYCKRKTLTSTVDG
jgi:quinol monooxygenase YgiN